jgi:hypothetical protein
MNTQYGTAGKRRSSALLLDGFESCHDPSSKKIKGEATPLLSFFGAGDRTRFAFFPAGKENDGAARSSPRRQR